MSTVPDYKIAFKNESTMMKIIGKILFFNSDFMHTYATTVGNKIYFPTRQYVKIHPVTALVILLHELVHIKDSSKITGILFSLLYLLPQGLVILAIPFFFFHWWLVLSMLLFALPIPAYFRMKFELKAYTMQLYAMCQLRNKKNYTINIQSQIDFIVEQFSSSEYYFMWPFASKIRQHLTSAVASFQAGDKTMYDAEYFDMVDSVIDSGLEL